METGQTREKAPALNVIGEEPGNDEEY